MPKKKSGKRKYSHALVIAKLGNECAICHCRETAILQIDHLLKNGAQERKTKGQQQIYKRIMEGYSSEYRCLCASCNWREWVRHFATIDPVAAVSEASMKHFLTTLKRHLELYLEET